MKKSWVSRIGILILVIIIAYYAIWPMLGIPFSSKNFPLSQKWSKRLGANIQQISMIDNKVILARTGPKLYALDKLSGDILWQQDASWQLNVEEPVIGKNGMLFLTDSKDLWALNQSDGEILWHQDVHFPASAAVVDTNQDFVAVSDMPDLNLYQAENGTLRWSKNVCRNTVQAYFYESNIYVPCYGLIAINIDSGETVWETEYPERTWESAFADGVLYASPDLANVTAYDVVNRKQLWSTPLPNDRAQGFKVIGERLLVTDNDQLCVLQRDTGKILWCASGILKPLNPVIIEDGLYLYNQFQNEIIAFDLHTGDQIGRLTKPAIKWITVDVYRQWMVSSGEALIFASGPEIFALEK